MYEKINSLLTTSEKWQIVELIHSPRIIFTSRDCNKCLRLKLLACILYASIRPKATINIIDAHHGNTYVWQRLLDIIDELGFSEEDFSKFVAHPVWGNIVFKNGARIQKISALESCRGRVGDFFIVDEVHAENESIMDLIRYMCRHCKRMQEEHESMYYLSLRDN